MKIPREASEKTDRKTTAKISGKIFEHAYFGNKVVPIENANLSVASSAVLYGLSVYTVFPVMPIGDGQTTAAFCLEDHYNRLVQSAKIIGIDTFEPEWNYEKFKNVVSELIKANQKKSQSKSESQLESETEISEKVFVRATVHVSELVPGTRSRGLETLLSMFVYEAKPIIPQNGARLKTSVWRRIPDYAIPSRAKVNGAYVNSVLGKQDAIDSGYDDCLFLDTQGHVCELSAANIFIIRNRMLITPERSSDILEGINRKVVLELAKEMNIPIAERTVDLTELYIADEIFACGTSSSIAPIIEIDARKVGSQSTANKNTEEADMVDADIHDIHTAIGPITKQIKDKYDALFDGTDQRYLTVL